jgi:shikimate O-hydroxycinnamoyltransferase
VNPIPLSPIDHVFTGVGSYPIEFVFAYGSRLDEERLRTSLEVTLGHFPPMRTRLVRTADRAFGFQPGEDGLSFVTAESDATFAETKDFTQLIDSVETVEGEPLTRVKLTHTPAGSVLGVSISHAVADGFSYFHFLASWSRIHQGQPILEPAHQRALLIPKATDPRSPITPEEVFARSGLFWAGKRSIAPWEQLRWDRLEFPREELNSLVAEAQADCDLRLTHNDALVAHLWRTYVHQWSDSGHPLAYASIPFDFRRVLQNIPRTYCGCAVALAVADIDQDSLTDASLGQLAGKIRRAVDGITPTRIHDALQVLDEVRRQEGLPVLEELHVVPPRNGLLMTNLSRLPVRELVFDGESPTGFHILTPTRRGAVVLPAADGVEVQVFPPAEGEVAGYPPP